MRVKSASRDWGYLTRSLNMYPQWTLTFFLKTVWYLESRRSWTSYSNCKTVTRWPIRYRRNSCSWNRTIWLPKGHFIPTRLKILWLSITKSHNQSKSDATGLTVRSWIIIWYLAQAKRTTVVLQLRPWSKSGRLGFPSSATAFPSSQTMKITIHNKIMICFTTLSRAKTCRLLKTTVAITRQCEILTIPHSGGTWKKGNSRLSNTITQRNNR